MVLNSSILVAAVKDQEEFAGRMDGSSDDQIYVGQKCQDTTEEGTGKEEARRQRDLLEETSFTESGLKERKEGHRNPFSNVPFPSTKNKEHAKVGLTNMNVYKQIHYHYPVFTGCKEKRPLDEAGRIDMAW